MFGSKYDKNFKRWRIHTMEFFVQQRELVIFNPLEYFPRQSTNYNGLELFRTKYKNIRIHFTPTSIMLHARFLITVTVPACPKASNILRSFRKNDDTSFQQHFSYKTKGMECFYFNWNIVEAALVLHILSVWLGC